MKEEEVKVMFDSPEAAQLKTITGWVSRDGRYWGNDEQAARYSGCTHAICACGNDMKRGYTLCNTCINSKNI